MGVKKACSGLLSVEDSGTPGTYLPVAEVTQWSEDGSVKEITYDKIGNCQEQTESAGETWSVPIEGKYDPADAGQAEILQLGATIKVQIDPVGVDTGDERVIHTGVLTAFNRTGAAGDLVTFSATLKSNDRSVSVIP